MKCYTVVDNIQVDHKIFTTKFCCDYEKCEGACCNQPIGEELYGGALSDYDAAEILLHRKELSLLCDKDDQETVRENPVEKHGDTFFTTLHKEKCALCSMVKGTCVLQIAKHITGIGIPLSCQLYPIVWNVYPDHEELILDDLFYKDYCVHAYAKGEEFDIFLLDFLKAPLIRGLGEDFFNKLKEIQKEFL